MNWPKPFNKQANDLEKKIVTGTNNVKESYRFVFFAFALIVKTVRVEAEAGGASEVDPAVCPRIHGGMIVASKLIQKYVLCD